MPRTLWELSKYSRLPGCPAPELMRRDSGRMHAVQPLQRKHARKPETFGVHANAADAVSVLAISIQCVSEQCHSPKAGLAARRRAKACAKVRQPKEIRPCSSTAAGSRPLCAQTTNHRACKPNVPGMQRRIALSPVQTRRRLVSVVWPVWDAGTHSVAVGGWYAFPAGALALHRKDLRQEAPRGCDSWAGAGAFGASLLQQPQN